MTTMPIHDKSYYLRLRKPFIPSEIRLILIAESPPASGKYFYDEQGKPTEPLFSALMSNFLGLRPQSKREGLIAFQEAGLILLDSTYTPVNKEKSGKNKQVIIRESLPFLLSELETFSPGMSIPLLLIKANVCRALNHVLEQRGFQVINKHRVVPFPSTGQQKKFLQAIDEIGVRIPGP